MLPDYVLNDIILQSLPNRDEIILRQKTITNEKITKQILMAVYETAIQDITTKNEKSRIPYSDLRLLDFIPSEHANIVLEFLRSKGFKVNIDHDTFVVSIY